MNPDPVHDLGSIPEFTVPAPLPTYKYHLPSYDPNVGFRLIDPVDPKATPYRLDFNIFFQPRYTGFSRANPTFTQANGQVVQVNNTSDLQMIRMLPYWSGYAFSEKFYYTGFVFMSSTTNTATPLGWVGYKFADEFGVEASYWKPVVNREFNSPFTRIYGTEWSMATTFFRPNYGPGAKITGKLFETLTYNAGLWDAFAGAAENFSPFRTNTNLLYAQDLAWEPLGEFGTNFEDFAYSEKPLVRLGTGFATGRGNAQADDISGPNAPVQNPNNTILRVSDGTPLEAVGVLGKGIAVRAANLYYLTIDNEWKYRGFNVGVEYNFRWLNNFRVVTVESGGKETPGGTPNRSQLLDHGGWLYAGYFVLPKQLMLYGKASLVTGNFGTGWEAGGGVAYYPFKTLNARLTLEFLHLNRSPAVNVLTPYLYPGQTGTVVMAGGSFNF